ncbi:hypothetical protein [Ensifer adhaerens]|uniref:hypothetical protein n=1 Tax=Ensifer adhaerens TaxID=106592 RepID=UPI001567E7D6|nr:hypothetical protein [Ensifer adhaerens]
MDNQLYELVRQPFRESLNMVKIGGRGHSEALTSAAFDRLIDFGRSLVANAHPTVGLVSLFSELQTKLHRERPEQKLHKRSIILFTDPVEDRIAEISQGFLARSEADGLIVGIAIFCAICVETSIQPSYGLEFETSNLSSTIIIECASYAAWKAIEESDPRLPFSMDTAVVEMNHRVQDLVTTAQQQLQTALEKSTALQQQDAALRQKLEGDLTLWHAAVQKLESDATAVRQVTEETFKRVSANETRIALTDENVRLQADAIRQELGIYTTKKLWRNRAFFSAIAFWLSALAIATLLVGPIWYAFSHLQSLIQTLREIGDAATAGLDVASGSPAQLTANAVARLAVITIPVAIYLWGVKLVVRYNSRSMMLMDDARQRQTMMDVYTFLIEQDKASPEERGLVLNALFRPAPGHGAENVEPPNFTEILGKATGK